MKKEVIQLDSLAFKIVEIIIVVGIISVGVLFIVMPLLSDKPTSVNILEIIFSLFMFLLSLFIAGYMGHAVIFCRKIIIDLEQKEIVFKQINFKLTRLPFNSITSINSRFKAKFSDFRWGSPRYIIPRIFFETDTGKRIMYEGYMCLFPFPVYLKKQRTEDIVKRLNDVITTNKF